MNQPQIQIKPQDTKEILCSKCGNNTFSPCYLMREVKKSAIVTSKKTLLPIEVFGCNKCHHVLEDTLPIEMQQSPKNSLIK